MVTTHASTVNTQKRESAHSIDFVTIFGFIKPKRLISVCMLVSREWRKIISERILIDLSFCYMMEWRHFISIKPSCMHMVRSLGLRATSIEGVGLVDPLMDNLFSGSTLGPSEIREMINSARIGIVMNEDDVLSGFSSLKVLSLQDLHLSLRDVEAISSIDSLESIIIDNCIIESNLRPISRIASLEQFSLYNQGYISLAHLMDISRMKNLRRLSLCDATLRDFGSPPVETVTQLEFITHLDLDNNTISETGLRQIASIPSLRALSIGYCGITPLLCESFSRLYHLTRLDMPGNSASDEGAALISMMPSLTQLNLSRNKIGDNGALSISLINTLERLTISGNYIGPQGAKSISSMNRLRRLDISSNWLYSEGIRYISSMPHLEYINLSHNGESKSIH